MSLYCFEKRKPQHRRFKICGAVVSVKGIALNPIFQGRVNVLHSETNTKKTKNLE